MGFTRRGVLTVGAGGAAGLLGGFGLGRLTDSGETAATPVGILAALPGEVTGLASRIEDQTKTEAGGRTYLSGKLAGADVAFVITGAGDQAMAVAATELVSRFDARALILVGTSGALDPGLRVGDVVVAERAYQLDFDARPFYPRFEMPDVGRPAIALDRSLGNLAQERIEAFIDDGLDGAIAASVRRALRIDAPRAATGTVVSSESFQLPESQQRALGQIPERQAIDFESAAAAHVGHDYGVPTVVIRLISNVAPNAPGGSSAGSTFEEFTKKAAGAYAVGILESLVPAIR